MTIYMSNSSARPGGAAVYAVEADYPPGAVRADMPSVEKLSKRADLADHSNGFSWGYRGSGPAQLALAILAHACSEETAKREYQTFKEDVVAAQPGDEPFRITEQDILNSVGDSIRASVGASRSERGP